MKIMTALAGMRVRRAKLTRPRRAKISKSISDHMARDIGISQAELDQTRFIWPSESKDRPLL